MYFNEETILFLNGEFVKAMDSKISLYNQTMHYGNGVFEGIRSYETELGTNLFKAKEHFERLLYSAKQMHIKLHYTVSELEEITYKLLELNNIKDGYVRPLIFLGKNMSLTPTPEVHMVIMAWKWDKTIAQKSLKVMLSSYQRPNPKSCITDAKVVGHYTNSILATSEARANGYDEALLTDMNGYIAQGSGANFFYEKDNYLFTAPKGNILPGITREIVLDIAKELGYMVKECLFSAETLQTADSAFFCGTASEIQGIKKINNYVLPQKWENSIGFKIAELYSKRVITKEPITISA